MGQTLTQQQTEKASQFFNSIDTDRSGSIELKELGKKLKLRKAETIEMMKAADLDGNHTLDFNEFLIVFETRYRGLFNQMDQDGSGCISGNEFKGFIMGMGFEDEAQIDAYVQSIDTDGNQTIDFLEFVFGLYDIGVF
eukprot:TRINITY_DN6181_c0_g1_i1.p1 TRINITY_DN6181_c0_g1~~TRINITY_DN6181_c0_g1_i1.p1  ORF type:complete len:138 (-),score=37.98 TRINITY_DN6181_c0_g1_i1:42-455(-)